MLTTSDLKQRGWTDTAITRFLGEPDQLKTNPYRRSQSMKLFDPSRVDQVEASETFKVWLTESTKRQIVAKQVASSKREQIMAWAESVEINVPSMSLEQLRSRSISHYNVLWSSRGDYEKYAHADSDSEFLNRIAMNYLRHQMTNYEVLLDSTFGKVGTHEAYPIIKNRVNAAIIERYPEIAELAM